MLLRSAFVLLLSACISYAKAQIIIPRFEAIGVNEGLSQSSVYSILQDKFGYMWFGTADGLNRYDGSEIRVYKLYDSSFRETNFIRGNLCEDVNGAIWFCNEAGIFYYDPIADKLKIARTFSKKEFHGYGFEAVFIRNGVLWMLGGVRDVYSYDLHTGDMNKYSFAATKETLLPLPFYLIQKEIFGCLSILTTAFIDSVPRIEPLRIFGNTCLIIRLVLAEENTFYWRQTDAYSFMIRYRKIKQT